MSAAVPELSGGVVLKLMDGVYPAGDVMLQVLDFYVLNENLTTRMRLSDGLFFTSFAATDGFVMRRMSELCVIRLVDFQLKEITKDGETRNLIMIKDAKVLNYGYKKMIGNPENFENKLSAKTKKKTEDETEGSIKDEANTSTATEKKVAPFPCAADFQGSQKLVEPVPSGSGTKVEPVPSASGTNVVEPVPSGSSTTVELPVVAEPAVPKADPNPCPGCPLVAVKDLGSKVMKWTGWVIKVRVVGKLPLKKIHDGRGKMCSWELADKTGTITALAFNEQCDRLAPMQFNKGYWVSGAQFRLVKNPVKKGHPFELKFGPFTFARDCINDSDLPSPKFVFTSLRNLPMMSHVGKFVSIVGVCSRASKMMQNDDKGSRFRRVKLVGPDVGLFNEVELELPEPQAEKIDASSRPSLVVTGCRVGYEEGRMVVFLSEHSLMLVDPRNVRAAVSAKAWFRERQARGEVTLPTTFVPVLVKKEKFDQEEIWIENVGFSDARKKVLVTSVRTAHVRCQVTVIDTDAQYFANMICTACRSQVYDMNFAQLVCPLCGFVEGGVIKNLLTKVRIGDDAASEWVQLSDPLCRKVLDVSSPFMKAHDTSLWKKLQALAGRQFHAHIKYDKSRNAKKSIEVVDMDPMPEDIYF